MMALKRCHASVALGEQGARLSLVSLTLSYYCVEIETDCATEVQCNTKLMQVDMLFLCQIVLSSKENYAYVL